MTRRGVTMLTAAARLAIASQTLFIYLHENPAALFQQLIQLIDVVVITVNAKPSSHSDRIRYAAIDHCHHLIHIAGAWGLTQALQTNSSPLPEKLISYSSWRPPNSLPMASHINLRILIRSTWSIPLEPHVFPPCTADLRLSVDRGRWKAGKSGRW